MLVELEYQFCHCFDCTIVNEHCYCSKAVSLVSSSARAHLRSRFVQVHVQATDTVTFAESDHAAEERRSSARAEFWPSVEVSQFARAPRPTPLERS